MLDTNGAIVPKDSSPAGDINPVKIRFMNDITKLLSPKMIISQVIMVPIWWLPEYTDSHREPVPLPSQSIKRMISVIL